METSMQNGIKAMACVMLEEIIKLKQKKRLLNFIISGSCLEKQPPRESLQQKQETFLLWDSIPTMSTAICKSPTREPKAKVHTKS